VASLTQSVKVDQDAFVARTRSTRQNGVHGNGQPIAQQSSMCSDLADRGSIDVDNGATHARTGFCRVSEVQRVPWSPAQLLPDATSCKYRTGPVWSVTHYAVSPRA
jgi:hypothetical protein